ncbi:QRIC2 protein, partial [Serilophus lunatus]|nr:QRIC2 protein [Serilophus lunatus]
DQELLQHMKATVSKIQGVCEELSFVSGNLQKDCDQKQKAIEMLSLSLERLQKEKADEENLLAAMDVKADKAALGSKVNCTQFEASMERLEERMQDMQGQVLSIKAHCNQIQQQLSNDKPDRQELKDFQEHVMETWQRSVKELRKEKAEHDSAAGIRK